MIKYNNRVRLLKKKSQTSDTPYLSETETKAEMI